jgi:hypothetical protein
MTKTPADVDVTDQFEDARDEIPEVHHGSTRVRTPGCTRRLTGR